MKHKAESHGSASRAPLTPRRINQVRQTDITQESPSKKRERLETETVTDPHEHTADDLRDFLADQNQIFINSVNAHLAILNRQLQQLSGEPEGVASSPKKAKTDDLTDENNPMSP